MDYPILPFRIYFVIAVDFRGFQIMYILKNIFQILLNINQLDFKKYQVAQ